MIDLTDRAGHTDRDHRALTRADVDPTTVQAREHDVRCALCGERTWHHAGRCDAHYQAPFAARLCGVQS